MTETCCTICCDEKLLIKPPDEYKCQHQVCENCWKNIALNNPVCPFCRTDLTSWFEELNYKIDRHVCDYEIPEEFIREDMIVRGNYAFDFIDNYIRNLLNQNRHRSPSPLRHGRAVNNNIRVIDTSLYTALNNNKISCKCGSIFKDTYLERHQISRKHLNYITNNRNTDKYLCECGKYIVNKISNIQRHQQSRLHTRLLNS